MNRCLDAYESNTLGMDGANSRTISNKGFYLNGENKCACSSDVCVPNGSNGYKGYSIQLASTQTVATSAQTDDCEPRDSDTCLQQAEHWGTRYTCAGSTQWCTSWPKDVQRCCPISCGTGSLSEEECNALGGSGNCVYPNDAQSCDEAAEEVSRYEYQELGIGFCSTWTYLPEGGYPNFLPSSHSLYDHDRKRECMNRCLDAYESNTLGMDGANSRTISNKGFYLNGENKCACSSDVCVPNGSNGYKGYSIQLASTQTVVTSAQTEEKCADENEWCFCDGEVRYGAQGSFTDWRYVSYSISCTNLVFGDPINGVVKECFCRPSTGRRRLSRLLGLSEKMGSVESDGRRRRLL